MDTLRHSVRRVCAAQCRWVVNNQLTAAVLARASGTTVHTVRHYTRKGLLKPIRNPGNRYHLYRPKDTERLQFIWQAQRLGFGLKEIREILMHSETGGSPCPGVRDILRQRVQQNRKQLDAMMALQRRMEQALAQWQAMPDGVPNGDSICYLIESFNDDEVEFE